MGMPGLEVFVNGVKQNQVSVTKIVIWNAGQKTIRSNDVAQTEPIVIVATGDFELLSADVYLATRAACQIAIKPTEREKRMSITFDFLAHRDGAIIRFIHNGSTKAVTFELNGTLVEGDPIRSLQLNESLRAGETGLFDFRQPKSLARLTLMLIQLALIGILILFLGRYKSFFPPPWDVGIIAVGMIFIMEVPTRILRRRLEKVHPYIPITFEEHLSRGVERQDDAIMGPVINLATSSSQMSKPQSE